MRPEIWFYTYNSIYSIYIRHRKVQGAIIFTPDNIVSNKAKEVMWGVHSYPESHGSVLSKRHTSSSYIKVYN